MISIQLPTSDMAKFLWMEYVVLWTLLTYMIKSGPFGRDEYKGLNKNSTKTKLWKNWILGKTLSAFIIGWIIPGFSTEQWPKQLLLATLVAGATALTPFIRKVVVSNKHAKDCASLVEILLTATVIIAIGISIYLANIQIINPLLVLPISIQHLSRGLILISVSFFLMGGATHIIRGILDIIGMDAKPQENESQGEDDAILDEKEYNFGRIIGNIERLLLYVFALLGAYQAMAIVVALKGLVRLDKVKQPEFAEYFLLGNFLSVLIAILVGLLSGIILQKI